MTTNDKSPESSQFPSHEFIVDLQRFELLAIMKIEEKDEKPGPSEVPECIDLVVNALRAHPGHTEEIVDAVNAYLIITTGMEGVNPQDGNLREGFQTILDGQKESSSFWQKVAVALLAPKAEEGDADEVKGTGDAAAKSVREVM